MDEAVADSAPDRSNKARMCPGQGRMLGVNTAVAGPCQRDDQRIISALMTLRLGMPGESDDDVTGLQPGTVRGAADALSMKLRDGGPVVSVHVLVDGLSDERPSSPSASRGPAATSSPTPPSPCRKTRCGRAPAELLERQVDDYPGPSGQIHSRDTAGSPRRAKELLGSLYTCYL